MTPTISGSRLFLAKLEPHHVTPTYLAWMHDPEVLRYLEARFLTHTLESLQKYIDTANANPDDHMFGICESCNGRHIGNLKIGPIHPVHQTGEIGILIGEKDCWGRGYATEAIHLVCRFAFESLRIRKATAGAYAANTASIRAFLKNGFQREGYAAGQYTLDDLPHDGVRLGLLATDFRP